MTMTLEELIAETVGAYEREQQAELQRKAEAEAAQRRNEIHVLQQLLELDCPRLYPLVQRWAHDGVFAFAEFDNGMTLMLEDRWVLRDGYETTDIDKDTPALEHQILLAMGRMIGMNE
jgi:hypothetical protein